MKEAKKCLKDKGIRSEYVKNLPPIQELCKPISHSSTIEEHSLQHFDEGDIPYGKPPDQCLEELDTFICKQGYFKKQVRNHLLENSRAINDLKYIVERTSNDVKMLVKHFQMVQTQIDQLTKCRCVVDITRRRVSSRRGVRVGGIRRSNTGRDDTSLPSFETRCMMAGPTAALFGIIWAN